MEYLFETEHLKVRTFGPSDAPDLYQIHLDEEVKKWFPNESYADIDEAAQAIRFYADCVHHQHLPYVLAVVLKSTGELIGDAGGIKRRKMPTRSRSSMSSVKSIEGKDTLQNL